MTVASTGKAMELADQSEADDFPIDVDSISSHTDSVLSLRMGTTTRAAMDQHLPRIAKELNHLLAEDLGAEDDSDVRDLVRKGTRLVDLTNRPNAETPTFGNFLHLRDVALLTRRLLWIYSERNGLDAP
ncbi:MULTISPECIES: hypothetical protein [unclassified Streptomyces]|uniref:hypothetical protein n=1 Tax=unclassified Streptomyces TaxID=2593676 RepID=UPI001EEFD6D2|nr:MULTISPECIES: hypothetical protein [unclassified Streptomyces]